MKYHNKKTQIGDLVFDSKKEANRYCILKDMEDKGEISDLRLQVKYQLLPSQKEGLRTERPITYIADFVYEQDGETIVEDVKGIRTDVYKIKRKLMKYFHGIEVHEI